MNGSRDNLPLRQTCNRCRELKVRCQTRHSNHPAGTAQEHPITATKCLRCLRAGANCTFSSKERSGRPPVARRGTLQTSTSSTLSPQPMKPYAHNSVDSSAGESSPQNSGSDSWSNHLGMDTFSEESNHPAVENIPTEEHGLGGVPHDIMTSSLTWSGMASDFPSSKDTDMPPYHNQQLHEEADNTLLEMNELAGLNSSIYQFQVRVATLSLTPSLCDEMTAFTRSLVTLLTRIGDGARNRSPDHQDPRSTAYPSSLGMFLSHQTEIQDGYSSRQIIESSIYPGDDYGPVRGISDSGSLFLILACYQRLFCLFKQLCISIHLQLEDGAESHASSAQIVMTTELISHLLGRLDRGLQQLFPVGPPTPPPPSAVSSFPQDSMLTPSSMFAFGTNLAAMRSSAKNRSAFACEDLFSNGASGNIITTGMAKGGPDYFWSQGGLIIMHKMLQRQKALKAHIGILRSLVQESDNF